MGPVQVQQGPACAQAQVGFRMNLAIAPPGLLLQVLDFLRDDVHSCWSLADATGYPWGDDEAVHWFLIE